MTANNQRQFAYDIAMRFKTRDLLANAPDFPVAGKYFGWFAFAAGTVGNACYIFNAASPMVTKLFDETVSAIFLAAGNATKTDDPHLHLAQEYFALTLFQNMGLFTRCNIKKQQKAFAALARLFPHLARLNQDLQRKKLNASLRKLSVSQS